MGIPVPQQQTPSDVQSKASDQWSRVVGLIAAPELPTKPASVADCVIFPLGQIASTPTRQESVRIQTAAPNAAAIVTVEPEVRFNAIHAIATVVPHDPHAIDTLDIARKRFDRAIGLLGVAVGPEQNPPLYKIVSLIPVAPGTKAVDILTVQVPAAAAPSLTFGGMFINPMTDATAGRLSSIAAMARDDGHVARLVRLWGAAEQANRLCFSDADRDACHVHFAKVIEQVTIAMKLGRFEPTEEELMAIITPCEDELTSDSTVSAKARAIEVANAKLRELRAAGMIDRCRKALDVLEVDVELRERALGVIELRNKRSAHPADTPVTDGQVTDARWTAAELLRLFFNWRWRQAK